jgi:hypothetical protein
LLSCIVQRIRERDFQLLEVTVRQAVTPCLAIPLDFEKKVPTLSS